MNKKSTGRASGTRAANQSNSQELLADRQLAKAVEISEKEIKDY